MLMGEGYETSLKGQTAGEQSNNQNLADPASEKVHQKKNTILMLKSYHENQREQNQNYEQLNWLGKVA